MKSEKFKLRFYREKVMNNHKRQYKLKFFTLSSSLFTFSMQNYKKDAKKGIYFMIFKHFLRNWYNYSQFM